MRFHITSLPHMGTLVKNSHCAYSMKCRRLCDMLSSLGHEVYLYGHSEGNDGAVTEFIPCSSAKGEIDWNPTGPHFLPMNMKIREKLSKRARPGDFLCLIAGQAQDLLKRAFPELRACEYAIGYQGVIKDSYRCFESQAWMHCVLTWEAGSAFGADGRPLDVVIPNSYHPDEFPLFHVKQNYAVYCGRLNYRKGVDIAEEVCKRIGLPLKIAGGEGDYKPTYGELMGRLGPEERNDLVGNAAMLFSPTRYLEPFGGIAVESQLLGTPVITSGWGAYPETNLHTNTGYRCCTVDDYELAAIHILNGEIDPPEKIREWALSRFSTEVTKHQYEAWFEKISGSQS